MYSYGYIDILTPLNSHWGKQRLSIATLHDPKTTSLASFKFSNLFTQTFSLFSLRTPAFPERPGYGHSYG